MVKQSRVVRGSDTAPAAASVLLKAGRGRAAGSRWKGLGRATGVFAAGVFAVVAAPRDAKAVGFFTDNTLTTLPNPQPCSDPNFTVDPGCYTSWLINADIDGDGDFDIIEANGGGYYATGNAEESVVLLNNGAGVFTDATPTLFGNAQNRLRQIAMADIDGDGDMDLYQPGGFGVDLDKLWVQTAPGVFVNKADTLLPAGLMSRAASAHMGDLDGDGDPDLIVMEWLSPASGVPSRAIMYTNDGTGKFTFAAAQQDPANASPTDRLPPTLTGGTGSFPPLGTNLITYASASAVQTPSQIFTATRAIDVDLADVDGDFDLDILVNNRNGYSRILLNDGHGNFKDGTNLSATLQADGLHMAISTNYPVKRGPYVYNQEVCDIDEDGDLDILLDNAGPKPAGGVQNWALGLSGALDVTQVLLNDGHGKFVDDTLNRIVGEPGGDDNVVKCIDANQDGHYDMIVATLSGRSEKFLLNDGTAHFTFVPDAIPYATDAKGNGDSSLGIDAGDLNGDKILDFITGQGESFPPFLNRVYFGAGLSAVDKIPPVFRAVSTPAPLAETPTVIRMGVRDGVTSEVGQMVKSVSLTYAVTGGATKSVTAKFYGGDLFSAAIPAEPAGAEVTVTPTAVDRAGNIGYGTPFKFTVPTPVINSGLAGSGGTAGTAGSGGSAGTGGATGGTGGAAGGIGGATGGTAGADAGAAGALAEAGAAGEAPTGTGGVSSGGTSGGKAGSSGKAGSPGKAGSTSGGDAGDSSGGSAGKGSHTTTTDDGGCAVSSSSPATNGRGAALLGLGLAMLGVVRRRRNKH